MVLEANITPHQLLVFPSIVLHYLRVWKWCHPCFKWFNLFVTQCSTIFSLISKPSWWKKLLWRSPHASMIYSNSHVGKSCLAYVISMWGMMAKVSLWENLLALIFICGWCSTGVEVELGGERRISEHSSVAMFCVLGLQVLVLVFIFS